MTHLTTPLLTSALALGAMHAFPQLTLAQARRLVFATFTGSWEEAHKDVLVPAFRKANGNAEITLDPDAVGRPDRQGEGRAREPADRRDAARSGPGAGRDRPGPGRALSRWRERRTTRT